MSEINRGPEVIRKMAPFKVDGLAIPYPEFVPRLYNFCKELGFRKGLMMPSRAFCSDENQGLPIILLTKHFGTFPFNHGRVGGIIAVDRHGPHAHHGEDLVIVQASHVGYDPDTGNYGQYRRPMMRDKCVSASCGKLVHVITPYLEQYYFARERIFLHRDAEGRYLVTVKNSFIDFTGSPVKNGLVVRLQKMAKVDEEGRVVPLAALSAAQIYEISDSFRRQLEARNFQWPSVGQEVTIGENLTEDLFFYRKDFHETDDSTLLERNLVKFMPNVVTSRTPPLRAAKVNIQLEFVRAVESIRRCEAYQGRNLLYVAGLNIDISEYDHFPATNYFVPWAAYVQLKGGTPPEYLHNIEQNQLFAKLMAQSIENPDQIDLKEEIDRVMMAPRFDIRSPA